MSFRDSVRSTRTTWKSSYHPLWTLFPFHVTPSATCLSIEPCAAAIKFWLFGAMTVELTTTMKLLPTLKILLVALLLADLSLSSVIAQDQPASGAATTSAPEGARPTKSTHSLRSQKRQHRRVARKSRAHQRRQVRRQQRHHKGSASQIKSTSRPESPTQTASLTR